MIARKFKISAGVGKSQDYLVAFDNALLNAGVGNYNLVRLSSILPAHCIGVETVDLEEGSLLPVAYSTISSGEKGDRLVSTIGIGFPADEDKVGVIMEYSAQNVEVADAIDTLKRMISEAFESRGWKLGDVKYAYSTVKIEDDDTYYCTFACVAEW